MQTGMPDRSSLATWRDRARRGGLGLLVLVLLATLASCRRGQPPEEGFRWAEIDGMRYKLYVPPGFDRTHPAPLVVMLHGCSQGPDEFAARTRMNEVARANGFLVAYPERRSSLSNVFECWPWWDPGQQRRGAGEPARLATIPAAVAANEGFAVDPNRVYVAGLSAGGAMASILAATYPDVFAAANISSGLEYGAAGSAWGGYCNTIKRRGAMCRGGPPESQQGVAAYAAMGQYARPVPVIVFHGTADSTVNPRNGRQAAGQWAVTDDLAADHKRDDSVSPEPDETTQGQVPGGRTWSRSVRLDRRTGQTMVELWMVDGMKHAWSGGTRGNFSDTRGPDESAITWTFFRDHPRA